jgi:hypothetical protein
MLKGRCDASAIARKNAATSLEEDEDEGEFATSSCVDPYGVFDLSSRLWNEHGYHPDTAKRGSDRPDYRSDTGTASHNHYAYAGSAGWRRRRPHTIAPRDDGSDRPTVRNERAARITLSREAKRAGHFRGSCCSGLCVFLRRLYGRPAGPRTATLSAEVDAA